MKQTYLDLMEKALSAYSDSHIQRYFNDVQQNGLTEHGFPRLTANIGILIAHGRQRRLLPIFLEMMEFCCKTIPTVKAANDFSVREIVCCIAELEQSAAVSSDDLARWKQYLATINPETCYSVFAKTPNDLVRNWALFSGVSEYYRQQMLHVDSTEFVETQIVSQLRWIEENGMYMDHPEDVHQPMVYDIVPRGLFCFLLHAGYRGKYYEEIDAILKKAALHTLKMQSVTGELAFGGRSNQFLHNEAWIAAIFEYEATRYQKEGNLELASKFKAAVVRALEPSKFWFAKEPIHHIKNRFPLDSNYGCEGYAYFDKYMITAASFFYAAYRFCDPSITPAEFDDSPSVWQTSYHFHKIFARAGGYSLEFDTNADQHYDASGLGRVHKAGAPSALCLSVPCPSEPNYTVDTPAPIALSLCPGILKNGEWKFACTPDCTYETLRTETTDTSATVALLCRFPDGETVQSTYTVDKTGVSIEVCGNGEVAFSLPAFFFDGDTYTAITHAEDRLTVAYEGWQCHYTTNGTVTDSGMLAANRNGHYGAFFASAPDTLRVHIELCKL